jgi:hypothetical protein
MEGITNCLPVKLHASNSERLQKVKTASFDAHGFCLLGLNQKEIRNEKIV